jgi:L-amino acid N-acyltransferase YncA
MTEKTETFKITLRNGDDSDIPFITELFNYYVLHSNLTIVEEILTEQEWKTKIDDIASSNGLFLVISDA